MDTQEKTKKKKKPSVAACIIALALKSSQVELWHNGAKCYATIEGKHLPLSSTTFKRWIAQQIFALTKSTVTPTQMAAAMPMIEGAALSNSSHATFERIARVGDTIYWDLGEQYVEITADGWNVVEQVPVKFIRNENSGVLPMPIAGRMDDLRQVIATNDDNWILIKGWLLDSLKGRGPYQVLIVNGPEGSAKTSTCRTLKAVIDPVISSPLLGVPRDEEGFASHCSHDYVLAFDNVSRLAEWQSDTISRIATGAGFRKRKLYTDDEQMLVSVARPQILNGIPEFAEAPDLLSRSVLLYQPVVGEYKTEKELSANFANVLPGVLGGLLDMVVCGLRTGSRASAADRMADSSAWITACGLEGWEAVYRDNKEARDDIVLDASPIAGLITKFVKINGAVKIPASELYERLKVFALDANMELSNLFPRTAKSLADRLMRDSSMLGRNGVMVTRIKSHGIRYLCLERT